MKRRILGALAALSLGAVPAAHADSNWLGITAMGWQQTPGWFVAPGVEGGFQRLPRWNSTLSLHAPIALGAPQINLFNVTPEVAGAGAGLTIGYVFNDGALPPWLGTRVRIGLTGTWQSFSDTANSTQATGESAVQYIGIDGRIIGLQPIFGSPITETLRVNRDGFDLNLRMASDFALRPDLTFTPSIAVFGGRIHDTYNYRHLLGPPFNFTFAIDERVRTTSIGGDFAAGFTWQATSFLALNITARGGAVWMRSRLEGADCLGIPTISCVPPFAIGVSTSTGSVTDSRSRVGFRGGLSLGAALDMRFGILSVAGSFTYDSAIPGVANPSLTGLSLGPGNVGPARIRFDDGFRYGGFLNLRIPLIWM